MARSAYEAGGSSYPALPRNHLRSSFAATAAAMAANASSVVRNARGLLDGVGVEDGVTFGDHDGVGVEDAVTFVGDHDGSANHPDMSGDEMAANAANMSALNVMSQYFD